MEGNTEQIKKILLQHGLDENKIDIALSAKRFRKTEKTDWHIMREHYEEIVDVPFCIKMYEKYKMPIYKLAMCYGVSDVTLRDYMIKHGVHLKGHACGRNSQNNYFEKIDTRDKAYFLGLLAADGSVVKTKTTSSTISIELKICDRYILERFNQYANLNASMYVDDRDKSERYALIIHSNKMMNDLAKYGIIPEKSHKDSIFIPAIKPNLIPHFIRGYFDGDGIANAHGYIGFCGSKTIVEQIHDYFVELYNVNNTKITFNTSNHIYYAQWGKAHDTRIISDVMYHDSVDLYLRRKQEKIFNRLRPEVWKHTDLNLSKPSNIGCPQKRANGRS